MIIPRSRYHTSGAGIFEADVDEQTAVQKAWAQGDPQFDATVFVVRLREGSVGPVLQPPTDVAADEIPNCLPMEHSEQLVCEQLNVTNAACSDLNGSVPTLMSNQHAAGPGHHMGDPDPGVDTPGVLSTAYRILCMCTCPVVCFIVPAYIILCT